MISADLLDQLREKDPELWMEITRTELAEIEYCDVDGDECEPDYIYWAGLRSEAQDAWLQHCLQERIRARGWGYEIMRFMCFGSFYPGRCLAKIYHVENKIMVTGEAKADTEAEALLRAYLQAIQEAA